LGVWPPPPNPKSPIPNPQSPIPKEKYSELNKLFISYLIKNYKINKLKNVL